MRHTHRKSLNLSVFIPCLLASLAGAGCSGADLSAANSGQGITPLNSTQTGGASSTSATATGGSSSSPGTVTGTGGASSKSTPTWTQLYNSYFGSGTPGSCTGCHGAGTSPSFNSASTMCTALKSVGRIQNGKATLSNLLTWFGPGGSMPPGGATTSPGSAVDDITAWQIAGAVCP